MKVLPRMFPRFHAGPQRKMASIGLWAQTVSPASHGALTKSSVNNGQLIDCESVSANRQALDCKILLLDASEPCNFGFQFSFCASYDSLAASEGTMRPKQQATSTAGLRPTFAAWQAPLPRPAPPATLAQPPALN
jgi:hypothetical protein